MFPIICKSPFIFFVILNISKIKQFTSTTTQVFYTYVILYVSKTRSASDHFPFTFYTYVILYVSKTVPRSLQWV
nr:MAG TPA_asm: hypothetical protein [Caudoviricetes sp.]